MESVTIRLELALNQRGSAVQTGPDPWQGLAVVLQCPASGHATRPLRATRGFGQGARYLSDPSAAIYHEHECHKPTPGL